MLAKAVEVRPLPPEDIMKRQQLGNVALVLGLLTNPDSQITPEQESRLLYSDTDIAALLEQQGTPASAELIAAIREEHTQEIDIRGRSSFNNPRFWRLLDVAHVLARFTSTRPEDFYEDDTRWAQLMRSAYTIGQFVDEELEQIDQNPLAENPNTRALLTLFIVPKLVRYWGRGAIRLLDPATRTKLSPPAET